MTREWGSASRGVGRGVGVRLQGGAGEEQCSRNFL